MKRPVTKEALAPANDVVGNAEANHLVDQAVMPNFVECRRDVKEKSAELPFSSALLAHVTVEEFKGLLNDEEDVVLRLSKFSKAGLVLDQNVVYLEKITTTYKN